MTTTPPALDDLQVEIEHNGDALTLEIEITRWPTKGGLECPGDEPEWRASAVTGGPDDHWFKVMALAALLPKIAEEHEDKIHTAVCEHCTEVGR